METQFRDGKTPCTAMHCSKTAPVAVKIGLAVGNAKVVFPSPPYLVPNSENRAVFTLIGSSWPLSVDQPFGQKLKAKVSTSPRNGSELADAARGLAQSAKH